MELVHKKEGVPETLKLVCHLVYTDLQMNIACAAPCMNGHWNEGINLLCHHTQKCVQGCWGHTATLTVSICTQDVHHKPQLQPHIGTHIHIGIRQPVQVVSAQQRAYAASSALCDDNSGDYLRICWVWKEVLVWGTSRDLHRHWSDLLSGLINALACRHKHPEPVHAVRNETCSCVSLTETAF